MQTELVRMGLTPYFSAQLTAEELSGDCVARITEVHRSGIVASDGNTEHAVLLSGAWFQRPTEQRPTVGDWVVLDQQLETVARLLDRKSVFKRMASGQKTEVQLIAANIDTLFIVTSCNDEFNESRLERYLSLAMDAGVDPVVVLSKVDLIDNPGDFIQRVSSVSPTVPVETVNALDEQSLAGLQAWITEGSTAAFVGSSGVGKSSLVNSLSGKSLMIVGGIREQDAKGRHTTTHRSLHRLESGGLLLDVPGMRELKVVDVDAALADLFDDIEALSTQCKFRDCQHENEPGCAVQVAIEQGDLEKRRLTSYRKLVAEDARVSATVAELRDRDKAFARKVKTVMNEKSRKRGD